MVEVPLIQIYWARNNSRPHLATPTAGQRGVPCCFAAEDHWAFDFLSVAGMAYEPV